MGIVGSAALTVAVATAGGLLFFLLGAPAAFLVGSAVAVMLGVVFKLPMAVPNMMRDPAFAILGVMMGAAVHPETLHTIATIPLAVIGLVVAVCSATAASYAVLTKIGKWDPVTALCGSIPGALQVTLAVSMDAGAKIDRVIMAQVLRLFVLVALVPLVFGGSDVPPIRSLATEGATALNVVLSVAIGLGTGYLGRALKLPTGMMVGPLLVSGILSSTGLVTIVIPSWLAACAFILLGASVAARFEAVKRADVLPILGVSLVAFVAAFAAAICSAAVVSMLTGEPLGTVFLAYSPGGLDAMIALAFLLEYDVAYVALLHVTRFILLSIAGPISVSWIARRNSG